MTKKGWLTIATFLLLSLGAIALLIYSLSQSNLEKTISVESEGITTETLTVKGLALHPGEQQEYTVVFEGELDGDFTVSLDYRETRNGGMKPFVAAILRTGGSVVYEGTLAELLNSDRVITFDARLSPDDPLTLSLCYQMPSHIGNEAQGTFAEFDITVTVERK